MGHARAAERVLEVRDPASARDDAVPHRAADLRRRDVALRPVVGRVLAPRPADLDEVPDRMPLAIKPIEIAHPVYGVAVPGRRAVVGIPRLVAREAGVRMPVQIRARDVLEGVHEAGGLRVGLPLGADEALAVVRVRDPTVRDLGELGAHLLVAAPRAVAGWCGPSHVVVLMPGPSFMSTSSASIHPRV